MDGRSMVMMVWPMEVGAAMVAEVAMAGRVMGAALRRLWEVCMLEAKAAPAVIRSIVAIIRGVGAGRGGLMRARVRERRRSMIEGIDDVDKVWLDWVVSGVCGMVRLGLWAEAGIWE
jgi:hypothetical protein